MKAFSFCLLVLFYSSALFSQNIPSFNMKDTVITISECYFYDPGGYKSGYPGGTTVLTFNSASGSTLGLSFDNCVLADDHDQVYVFDGNSVNAPLLTTVSLQGGPRAVRSSGSSLTIKFVAYAYGTTSAFGWKAHLYSLIDNPATTHFYTASNDFTPGNFDLCDYDHDGDMDVLNGGLVYRNDSRPDSMYWFDQRLSTSIGPWISASIAKADFDGDGYKDVFIMGQPSGQLQSARLYLNNRNGGFTLSPQAFTGATYGRCSVVDYNHDGRPDISYIGSANLISTVFIFKLYINNGDGTFTEQVTNILGMRNSSLSWADADGDGDMDIVVNGADASVSHALFLVNDNNSFTEKSIGLIKSSSGEINFVDLNKDGKPDIVNTGVSTPGNVNVIPTQLLINGGNNTFTSLANNLPSMQSTYTEWADYDGDGDLDLLMSGTNSLSPAAHVYKNNGNGNFTTLNLGPTESFCPVHWVDINKDGKPDIFVASRSGYSYIGKNMGNDSFAIVTLPFPAIDGTGGVAVDDFDNDGLVDVLMVGNLIEFLCNSIGNTAFLKGIGWKYGTTPKLTRVANLGSTGFTAPLFKWGDVDNDGEMDIIATNNIDPRYTPGPVSLKVYKGMGNNVFKLIYDGLPDGGTPQVAAVIDLDKDGKNELVMSPGIVYKWNGSGFDLVSRVSSPWSFCCSSIYMDFGDYNKDGFPDMAFNAEGLLHLFKNDGTGKLVEVDPNVTYQNPYGFFKWIDMDNDGDLDLVGTNFILENVNTDKFIYKDIRLPQFTRAALGDFNGDGYPDIFALTRLLMDGNTNLYYSQGPNFFYKEYTTNGLPVANNLYTNTDAVAVDIDNDGDQDILYATTNCANGLLLNNNNLFKRNIQLNSPAGGEKFYSGATYIIKWSGSEIDNTVTLLYSTDNGKSYKLISSTAASATSEGTYAWQIPAAVSSDSCLVKIIDGLSTSISNKIFTITTDFPTPQLSLLSPAFCQNKGSQTVNILNLPSIADSITASAMLDTASLGIISGQIRFRTDTLSAGKHTLTVKYQRNALSTLISDTFTIVTAVTPVVDLQASITNIVDLMTPVLLTASNLQGGGTSPTYTFASDLSFTHILQQESPNTTLTITPSTLNLGYNWIFVRMKTSDTCFTSSIGLDSISLKRDISTGIIDPDNPSSIINISPNPFDTRILITGLSSFKRYAITLSNATGQVILTKHLSNSNTVNVTGLDLPAGLYWISVFDETKKRKIGAMKLLRL